ncbi:MAG: ABC-2 family transporter protein [Rhizobiales bacterium]|nr:ABC-2 family transporter protein [Hyphomicrobiales bacterium]
MMKTLSLLVKMFVKSQMEYRGAFILDRVAQFIAYGSAYGAIWVLLYKFDTLGGWNWPELALLLSFQLLTHSLGAAFSFNQFKNFEELVRLGTFDTLLIKPISPWAYLTFSGLNIGYAGHIVLAVGLMIWALFQVDAIWTFTSGIYFFATLISASLLIAAITTMIGASAMVLVRSNYLFSIYFGFWELTRYPLNIYPAGLQWIMMTIVPLGFINYVPVSVFLGKDVVVLGSAAPFLSLIAGPIVVALAMLHWRFCLNRYQSGGG